MRWRRARPGLGTLVDIAFESAADIDADGLFQEAFACVETLEAQLSAHRDDSALNQLCDGAHLEPQRPGAAVHQVLIAALDLHRQSQGIFDVTRPWNDGATAAESSSADIQPQADGTVLFKRPLRIDLGGIAKGYVIDRMIELLQSRGANRGCVNAGGDLRVFGDHAEPVALRFADGFRVIAQLRDGAFAASRPGPRPMSLASADTADERHYDGRNRQPVSQSIEGADTVAVFAPQAMIADALTKIALVSAATMDRLCAKYSAEWRRYPFTLDP